jgi:hypothetical protein
MTVMVKVDVKEKRSGRKEDIEHSNGDSGSGQWVKASWAAHSHPDSHFSKFGQFVLLFLC